MNSTNHQLLTPKLEILKRLLENKLITFEEFLILNKSEVEYINTPWINNPTPLTPYFTNIGSTITTSNQ